MRLTTHCIALIAGTAACTGTTAPPTPIETTGTFFNGPVTVSYALDLPGGTGPFPAVVLAHGSGPTTKDNLRPLADQFTRLGFAVLRFDKRGVGGSGGVYSNVSVANSGTTLPLLSSDVQAGVRFLANRSEIDATRIGVAGASQAGWIIPVASASSEPIRFAIILSGPTTSVGLEIYYSNLAEGTATPLSEVLPKLNEFNGPHGFDPLATLKTDKVPTLWLYGSDDRSIPTQVCVNIHESLKAGFGAPFTVRVYPGAGHSLSSAIWPDIEVWLNEQGVIR